MNFRESIILLSYWILFILVPVAAFVYPFRGTLFMAPVFLLAMAAFILLGAKGFSEWKSFWKTRQNKK